MALTLATVKSSPNNKGLINRLARISPALGKEVHRILDRAVEETTEFCLKAYLSVSPIDTGELRGTGLGTGQIKAQKRGLSSEIVVVDRTHRGRYNRPKPASTLAGILDRGSGKRTQTSAAIDRFTPVGKGSSTANWIGNADRQIKSQIKSFLNSRDFSV